VAVIAMAVGTVLVGVNQGSALATGHLGWVLWLRVVLDYAIPTCVSTMGVLAGSRRAGITDAGPGPADLVGSQGGDVAPDEP
jgi:hypothetical protein